MQKKEIQRKKSEGRREGRSGGRKERTVEEKEEAIGAQPCFLCQDAERNGCGAGDFHALVLLSLGQQWGGQKCRERAEPTGANQAAGDWTLNSGILLVTGHFSQSRNLPEAVERSFQVKGRDSRA